MRVVLPAVVTMVSSTVPQSLYPEWSPATAYTTGQRIRWTSAWSRLGAWTLGAGWTESPAGTFTHSSGLGGLSNATDIFTGVGVLWEVSWVITGRTAGYVTITLAGSSKEGIVESGVFRAKTKYAGALTFWPSNDFDGSISAISLYQPGVPDEEYEALEDNTNVGPWVETTWHYLGPTNRHRMLSDGVISQTESHAATFTATFTADALCDYLGLLNVENVSSIRLTITAGSGPGYTVGDGWEFDASFSADHLRWTKTIDTRRSRSSGWFDWFSNITYAASQIGVRLAVPLQPGNILEILFVGQASSKPRVGHMVLGKSIFIGDTTYGVQLGISDYSQRDADEWGNITLVPRSYSPTYTADLEVPPTQVDRVRWLLASLRATACVYDGNPDDYEGLYDSMIVFGFFRDFSVLISEQYMATCSITLEGMT